MNAFTKLLADDTVWESDAFPMAFRGQEGARQFFQVYVGAFPDLRFDLWGSSPDRSLARIAATVSASVI